MNKGDEASTSIILASQALLVKMLITLETVLCICFKFLNTCFSYLFSIFFFFLFFFFFFSFLFVSLFLFFGFFLLFGGTTYVA